jgi:hypothetical protein
METDTTGLSPFQFSPDTINSAFFVSFPKSPDMDLILIGAELYQDTEQHDRLVLHYKGQLSKNRKSLVSDDPVKFEFSYGQLKSTWYGYIRHIEQPNSFQSGNTEIVCLGVSSQLKNTEQKIYKNVTADQVVSKIAVKYKLQSVTQRHPRVRTSIVQAGQSDWQLLKRLAKQSGFALRCENTSLFFVSKEKIFKTKKSSAPYFFYFEGADTGVATAAVKKLGTLLEFDPIISDTSPDSGVRVDRVITGVNPQTGEVIKVKHLHKATLNSTLGIVIPNETYFLQ